MVTTLLQALFLVGLFIGSFLLGRAIVWIYKAIFGNE